MTESPWSLSPPFPNKRGAFHCFSFIWNKSNNTKEKAEDNVWFLINIILEEKEKYLGQKNKTRSLLYVPWDSESHISCLV